MHSFLVLYTSSAKSIKVNVPVQGKRINSRTKASAGRTSINLHLTPQASRTRQTRGRRNYLTRARAPARPYHLLVHAIHKFNLRINPRTDITKACRKDNNSVLSVLPPLSRAREFPRCFKRKYIEERERRRKRGRRRSDEKPAAITSKCR